MKGRNDINKDLKAAIRANMRDELKAELEKTETGISGKGKITPMPKWFSVAAGIALLIFTGIYFNSNFQQDNSTLFAEYFEPFDNLVLPVNRSDSDVTNLNSLQNAFINYEAGNYEKAVRIFESIPADSLLNLDYKFYLSLSYMGTTETAKALPILEDLSKNDNFRFTKQSQWYLALAYLKMEEIEKAKEVFLNIKGEHPFKDEAAEILKIL